MSRLEYIKKIKLSEISFTRIKEAIERRAVDLPHKILWEIPAGMSAKNKKLLSGYKDKHKGERCFIMANGPSLSGMDLSPLKNEFTFGMNRIYLLKDKIGFLPTYLAVTDVKIQLAQFAEELQNLDTVRFFNWAGRKYFTQDDRIVYFRQSFKTRFAENPVNGLWGGHSVTNICIQLANFMGFSTIILIGKDHNYEQKGTPGKIIVSDGTEKNHFINNYYKKGMIWRIPDYKGEELGYTMARRAIESDGRKILDATVNGKLEVFDKVNYKDLF